MPGLPPGTQLGGAGAGLSIAQIRAQAPAGALPDPVTSSTALLASDFRTISIVHLERHWSAQADRYPGYTWAEGSQITGSDAGDGPAAAASSRGVDIDALCALMTAPED